jgi:hypothetical protein
MRARWWHQGRNAVDQLQRCKVKFVHLGTTLVTGGFALLISASVHQGCTLFTQPFHGKGWAGATPQQALQGGTVVDSMQTPASTEKPLCW